MEGGNPTLEGVKNRGGGRTTPRVEALRCSLGHRDSACVVYACK